MKRIRYRAPGLKLWAGLSLAIGLMTMPQASLFGQRPAPPPPPPTGPSPIAQVPQRSDFGPPMVSAAERHDVSPPLRSLKPTPPVPGRFEHPLRKSAPPTKNSTVNPTLQTTLGMPFTPSFLSSFDGVGTSMPGFVLTGEPSDSNGAVGSTQYVETVNTMFAIWDKTTGLLQYGPANINTLWSGFGGGCQTHNDGDPVVVYDSAADRWVISQFALVGTSNYFQCVAVSTSSDATGTYYRYAFPYSGFPDYPKMGVWPDPTNGGYFISFRNFGSTGSTFLGALLCAYDRNRMLVGNPATQQCFQLSSTYDWVLPAHFTGFRLPPAGSVAYFIEDDPGLFQQNVWKFHVDWVTPGSSTLTATSVAESAFTVACFSACVPQTGTAQMLDAFGGNADMFSATYRNNGSYEALYATETVGTGVGTQTGIHFYEIRTPSAPTIFQQGTYGPADGVYRWMPSLAVDHSGDMAVGYSVSNASMNPGIRFTGRTPADTLGTMEAEMPILVGTGSQTGHSRWGDYTAMTVDPVDDCTMWYVNQYLQTTGDFLWSTRIANFRFPNCKSPAILISPKNGSPLNANAIVFNWTTGIGAAWYWLYVGTCPGCFDIYNANQNLNTSASVNNIPAGGTVYVTLWTFISGVGYESVPYSFPGPRAQRSVLLSPTPGSSLHQNGNVFTWSKGVGVAFYYIYIGTCQGCFDVYNASQGTSTTVTVNGLPTSGTLYFRLWSYMSGSGYQYNDYTFQGAP